jgi:hypothetical protein
MLSDDDLARIFTPDKLEALLDPARYLGRAGDVVDDVIAAVDARYPRLGLAVRAAGGARGAVPR